MSLIIQEIEFCKSQIKKYSELYETLLTRYNTAELSKTLAPQKPQKRAANTKKSKKVVSDSDSDDKPSSKDIRVLGSNDGPCPIDSASDSEDLSETSASDDDFTQAVADYISHGNSRKLQVAPHITPQSGVKSKPVRRDPLEEKHDILLDELESFVQNDLNKKKIQTSAKEDDEDFKRIDKQKFDARAGLKAHDEKLSKIYAEEKRLLAQGLDPETVRKRVREMYYPEAIPAGERKSPSINVLSMDADGKVKRKQIDLLAFDEDYLEDDDPELTAKIVSKQESVHNENMPILDRPSIEEADCAGGTDFREPVHTNAMEVLDAKIQALLDADVNEADIVDETAV